ncbi:metallophosphoesterase family protein [Natronogracilivirga saccharolytica]|uniref:Serine/threonine protein phosphatase n=1 Tax=Natronogracilivirga saccharolytica TaxID=2812953 RepID=A0A8J7SCX4_9BACT|nr:metallophosphoesterase family protein [Natronogracilivirga saccharolytica]MBP3193736.1 serine/threonine protein phosphatase [Natronogracilivirga saccharolytica]
MKNEHIKKNHYIAIGDIHGCVNSLEALLEKVSGYNDRTFIFIGDYIDRGPDSRSVIDLVIGFSEDHDCIFLRGNHEQMFMDALETGDHNLWLLNGGDQTLSSYNVHYAVELPSEHIEFFAKTPLWLDTPQYFFIHGGLDPKRSIKEQCDSPDIEEFGMWRRDHVDSPVKWEKTLVFGHTPFTEPLHEERKIGIDTGCVFSRQGYGLLTAVMLPEETFITQPCLD